MSRISARGLVLGRRRDSDARVMALRTAVVRNRNGAGRLSMRCSGRCSNLSTGADSFTRAVPQGACPGSRRGGWSWGGDGTVTPGLWHCAQRWFAIAMVLVGSLCAAPVAAQIYPPEPIRLLVPCHRVHVPDLGEGVGLGAETGQ